MSARGPAIECRGHPRYLGGRLPQISGEFARMICASRNRYAALCAAFAQNAQPYGQRLAHNTGRNVAYTDLQSAEHGP